MTFFPYHFRGLISVMQCRYTEHWLSSFDDCYNEPPPVLHRGGKDYCPMWRKFRNVVVAQVKRETAIFSSFGRIVESEKRHLKDCRHCIIRADKWTDKVQRHIWDAEDSPFTSFL
ncbi:hypothetical protein BDZ97DRAFT_1317336 [Flammula alnicola]|nr:hypothetical protein BDZ97DRAFT_1317336 [Flammula alnicola]